MQGFRGYWALYPPGHEVPLAPELHSLRAPSGMECKDVLCAGRGLRDPCGASPSLLPA